MNGVTMFGETVRLDPFDYYSGLSDRAKCVHLLLVEYLRAGYSDYDISKAVIHYEGIGYIGSLKGSLTKYYGSIMVTGIESDPITYVESESPMIREYARSLL